MAAAVATVAEGGVSECRERHYAHQGEQEEAGGANVNGEGSDDDGGHGGSCGERGGDCFSHGAWLCKQGERLLNQAGVTEVTEVTEVTAVYKRA